MRQVCNEQRHDIIRYRRFGHVFLNIFKSRARKKFPHVAKKGGAPTQAAEQGGASDGGWLSSILSL